MVYTVLMSTTTKKFRTRRSPSGAYASGGAVTQDGHLAIYECTTCGNEVVWATSKKTGRKYLVNVRKGMSGTRYYVKANFHKCEEIMASREALPDTASEVMEDTKLLQDIAKGYEWLVTDGGDGAPRPFDTAKLTAFIHWIDTAPPVVAMRERMGL